MIVTNLKQISITDQNNKESVAALQKFAKDVFEAHNMEKGEDLNFEEYFEDGKDYYYYQIPSTMDTNLVMNMGAQLKSLTGTDIIVKPGSTIETIKHQFTAEENENNSNQLARYSIEANQIENEKKEVMSQYKARIDENKARIDKFANFVASGFEMREEKCQIIVDYDKKKRLYKSIATGQILKEIDLFPEDQQMIINLK